AGCSGWIRCLNHYVKTRAFRNSRTKSRESNDGRLAAKGVYPRWRALPENWLPTRQNKVRHQACVECYINPRNRGRVAEGRACFRISSLPAPLLPLLDRAAHSFRFEFDRSPDPSRL